MNTSIYYKACSITAQTSKQPFINDWNALHLALRGEGKETLEFLLSRPTPANIHAKDITGTTVLHMAVIKGQIEFIELLLKYGADPNIQTKFTALRYAVDEQAALLTLLIAHGADVSITDNDDLNPLANPLRNDNSQLVENLMTGQHALEPLLAALQHHGIDRKALDITSPTSLRWCIAHGHEVATWMVLHYGPLDVNTPVPGISTLIPTPIPIPPTTHTYT